MSRKPAPAISTPITTIEALDAVLSEMMKQGFFGRNEKYVQECMDEARQKVLDGQSEQWFSNGVDELKILSGRLGVSIYNFRNWDSNAIRAVQAAA